MTKNPATNTAAGTITSISNTSFKALFVINQSKYTYTADIDPSVTQFSSSNVTLTYDSEDELTGTHSYSGQIGIDDITLNLDNGPTITGQLDPPGVDPAVTVIGGGAWEKTLSST